MFQVRTLSADEWSLLRDLRIAALKESTEAFGGTAEDEGEWPEAAWQERLEAAVWLTVEDSGVPVGVVAVDDATRDERSDAWVWSWWIAPTHRGRGLSRLMLDSLITTCEAKGWSSMGLGAYESNTDAIATYERLAFERVGDPLASRSRSGTRYIFMRRYLST